MEKELKHNKRERKEDKIGESGQEMGNGKGTMKKWGGW